MTRHKNEESDCNTDFLIVCDVCETVIGNEAISDIAGEQGPFDNLPKGTLSINNGLNNIDICPTCRYEGATVQFLQFGLNSKKFGVDIIGALNSTLRICNNVQQYLDELKNLMAKYSNDDKDERRKAAFQTVANIENLINMARANDNIAIAELQEFGKPNINSLEARNKVIEDRRLEHENKEESEALGNV